MDFPIKIDTLSLGWSIEYIDVSHVIYVISKQKSISFPEDIFWFG